MSWGPCNTTVKLSKVTDLRLTVGCFKKDESSSRDGQRVQSLLSWVIPMLDCLSCYRITKAWFLFVRLAHNKDRVVAICAFGKDTSAAYVYGEWEW